MSVKATGSTLGVDVGYSRSRKSSAVCRIDWTETHINWRIKRFGSAEDERKYAICEVAGDKLLLAAAFDGPLRRGFDIISRYRAAERMLTRRLVGKIGKPGQSSAPVGKELNAATNICANIVKTLCQVGPANHIGAIDDLALTEAFPSSFMGLMLADPQSAEVNRYNRSDSFFVSLTNTGVLDSLIKFLLPARKVTSAFSSVTNHDERAALICALTALCMAANRFVAVGDEDGWIILPPRQFIQDWALADLRANDSQEISCLYISP